VKTEFRIAKQAQEIVDGLRATFDAGLEIFDGEARCSHFAISDRWLSSDVYPSEPERRGCYVEARINDRWTLYLFSRRRLHPDAEAMATWAARMLASYLPRRRVDEPAYRPPGGTGGPGGSAELGIPVWWARKARNN